MKELISCRNNGKTYTKYRKTRGKHSPLPRAVKVNKFTGVVLHFVGDLEHENSHFNSARLLLKTTQIEVKTYRKSQRNTKRADLADAKERWPPLTQGMSSNSRFKNR